MKHAKPPLPEWFIGMVIYCRLNGRFEKVFRLYIPGKQPAGTEEFL